MVRAGLEPPCAPESEVAIFPNIYADIGDAQDLTKDLSSFSAHMTQMIRLLAEADPEPVTHHSGEGRNPVLEPGLGTSVATPRTSNRVRGLVLLDEPVTSTDPTEGAALAEALLIRLASLGLKVVATTHYNSLKALAQTTPGFSNASVEFDVSRLAPTYRVLMGIPGGSSAIDIAGRLGMEEAILDHAQTLLKREDRNLEQMLRELQDKQRRLSEEEIRVTALRAEAEQAAREAEEVRDELQMTERERRKDVRKKLTDELLRARAQVQQVLEGLRSERTLIKAREAKERLAEIEVQARQRLVPEGEQIPLDHLSIGDRVEIMSLGRSGVLLESPSGKRRVRVRVGDTEMSVSAALLVGLTASGEAAVAGTHQGWPSPSPRAVSVIAGSSSGSDVLDLRGKTADEALDETIAMLDRAALAGLPSIRIIHGHGTGRLKTVLREYLKDSPYVSQFRAGERAEGGDGVTIAELR
jgi:DNA mismatch repair protein MutS2